MSKHKTYPPTPFYDRLTELSKLEDGWLDGKGKAPSTVALKAASVLGPALPGNITLHVYPTEAGGVSLEWNDQHGGHEIEVQPDGGLFLMTVERIAEDEMRSLRAEAAAARNPVERVGPDGLTGAERQRKTIRAVLEQHVPEMGEAQRWSITLGVQEALASLPVEVHRVSDEVLDGVVDEFRRGDR